MGQDDCGTGCDRSSGQDSGVVVVAAAAIIDQDCLRRDGRNRNAFCRSEQTVRSGAGSRNRIRCGGVPGQWLGDEGQRDCDAAGRCHRYNGHLCTDRLVAELLAPVTSHWTHLYGQWLVHQRHTTAQA